MNDQTTAQAEFHEKMWQLLNLQADAALKLAQTRYEPWKVVVGSMMAGGALAATTAAIVKMFG